MDLTRYLDVPDALLQQQFPGVDIAQLKEQIRNMGKTDANAKPVTQTIKIDPATGEQEVTIKGSAQDLSAANPFTPTVSGPVIPQAYNQFTAQMESGANPNIGYHDPSRSSAYGKYGITQPQYQEIQRQNPQFANRPITSLSQQEQDAANMSSRDVYARQLQAKGLDPSEENIRMAHLLGAGGTSQYLRSGTFNQAAIDANRGEENLRRMVEQRRAGPVAPGQPQGRPQPMIAGMPSSDVGLTPTEQAMAQMSRTPGFNPAEQTPTWMDMTIANQNDPKKLYAMVGDPNLPPQLQDAAKQRALSFDQQQQEQIRANEMLQGFAKGEAKPTSDILKAIRQKGEEGSYVKAVLFSQLGLGDLAKGEMAKLSSGKFDKAIVDGKSYLTETKMGAVVRAWDDSGGPVDEKTLVKLNTEPTDLRIHSTSQMYDPATRQYVTKQELSNGTQRFIAGGRTYAGNVNNLVPAEQFVAQENRRVNSAYSNLSKLTAKPTDEQRFMALRQAGVGPDRIEEELGYPAGTLTRRQAPQTTQTPGVVPTGPTAPVAQQPRGPVAPVAPGAPAPVAQAPQLTRPQPQPQPAGAAPIAVAQAEKYEPPVQQPGEPNTTFAKRQAEYDRFVKSKQGIAEKFVENAPKVQQSLANIRQGYDAVVNNQVNLGPSLGTGGAGPLPKVQQFFGEMVGTDESANTTLVRSLMNRQGLEGLKQSMGPQISNFDVQTWMSNNPIKENSPPEKIAEYLQKLHDELYRVAEQSKVNAVRLGYMDDSFDLGAPIKREAPGKPAEGKSTNKPQGKGTKNDPIKLD
jgi:hypothetical protein